MRKVLTACLGIVAVISYGFCAIHIGALFEDFWTLFLMFTIGTFAAALIYIIITVSEIFDLTP